MSWHDSISANLPPTTGDESRNIRRDILDELEDHLECAMRREFLREHGIDESTARRNVLKRFGDPAAVARRLWLDAMKGTLMNQRILIGTNILLAALVIAMFIIVLVSMQQNRQFQTALVDRLAEVAAAATSPAVEAPAVAPAADVAAMNWPTARIRVEGGNPPFRLQLQGELYNPGERITLSETHEEGGTVFGPMRPGRYTLIVHDDLGARHSRSVVVPPGGEHVVIVRAPDWQPQPNETRVRLDMPEDLAERLGVIAVLSQMIGSVGEEGRRWSHETAHLIVGHDGRAGRYEENPVVPGGILWSQRTAGPRAGARFSFNPDDFGLEDAVTLDASARYVSDGARLFYLAPEDDGVVYREMLVRRPIVIEPDEIASGDARVSLGLSEEEVAGLRAALSRLEDECAAIGAQRALGRENMCYILHGRAVGPADREAGYRLLVVLPGGDGSADFREFVSAVHSNALSRRGWLVAQAIAPVWDESQPEQIVWPIAGNPWPNMQFTTEEFVDAIIEDVSKTYPIDQRHIYALGWSSSGPPLYAAMMREETKLRGVFIAMSVFHPNLYPPAENAAGRSFYLLHSPQDFIQMRFPEHAHNVLSEAGANVQLQTYEGGHGWHGDVYGMIRRGIRWLESRPPGTPD